MFRLMLGARWFAGRSPFGAVLLQAVCGCSGPAEFATLVRDNGAGVDPFHCIADGALQNVRATATDCHGGVIVAMGPEHRRGGETLVQKLDADCNAVWTYRPAAGDMLWIGALAVDADGDVLIAGALSLASEKDNALRSSGAMTVVKLDPDGGLSWRDVTTWPGTYSLLRLTRTGDAVVRGRAHKYGDKQEVISKDDGAGHRIWTHVYPGEESRVVDVAVDGMGGAFVAGQFSSTVDFGGGPVRPAHDRSEFDTSDVFLVKYDKTGGFVWGKRFGDQHSQFARGVSVDADGNVTLMGRGRGTFDLGGGAVTVRELFSTRFNGAGQWLWSDPALTAP